MIKPEGRGFNSHPGQSFPLSLCGPISICRAKAHMVYGFKHQHFISHSITLSDFETVMEEIAEKFDASEKDAANQSEDKKGKSEKEKKQAEEIRNQALERVRETKKRRVDEADERRDQNSIKSRRKQGNKTIIYLNQKAEQYIKVLQEELQLKRDAQVAQKNYPKEMMQHLMKQHNQQMSFLNAFQPEQQQQMQQISQIQMSFIQQQQQQSQTLLSVLKELAQKK